MKFDDMSQSSTARASDATYGSLGRHDNNNTPVFKNIRKFTTLDGLNSSQTPKTHCKFSDENNNRVGVYSSIDRRLRISKTPVVSKQQAAVKQQESSADKSVAKKWRSVVSIKSDNTSKTIAKLRGLASGRKRHEQHPPVERKKRKPVEQPLVQKEQRGRQRKNGMLSSSHDFLNNVMSSKNTNIKVNEQKMRYRSASASPKQRPRFTSASSIRPSIENKSRAYHSDENLFTSVDNNFKKTLEKLVYGSDLTSGAKDLNNNEATKTEGESTSLINDPSKDNDNQDPRNLQHFSGQKSKSLPRARKQHVDTPTLSRRSLPCSTTELNAIREDNETFSTSTMVRRQPNKVRSPPKSTRSHSTGHSPDIQRMLQHLICDIEEEDSSLSSGEDEKITTDDHHMESEEDSRRHFDKSVGEVLRSRDNEKEGKKRRRLRRTFSDDDVGILMLRQQRQRRKSIASGEVTLKRKPSVIWAKVKNMEVTMVVDCDYGKQMKLKIESFEVRRMNTHCDVENIVTDTFMKHLQLLDKDALGLTTEDIKFLKLDTHNIPIGRPFNLSDVNIVDHFLPCQLYLKDKSSWSLSSIVYDTLIPKSFVEKYISTILSNNFTVFYGPSGTGKSYLARRLSHFTSHRINESSTPVILTNITPTKWKNLLKDIVQPSSFPKVYLLDGLTQGFLDANIDLTDIVRLCEDLHPKPYVICTFTLGPQYTIPSQWQQQLKWIWLPNQEEPVDTLLERYLRRKFIQFGNFHLQREYFRIVKWLADVWRHLNRIIQQFSEPEATLGPTLFFPCPTDLLEAEDWFSDLWNYSLCPYFIQSVGGGIKRYGQRGNEWTDPLQWIVETYPWSKNSKHKLTPITMADTGYVDHAQCNESSQNEKERLLHFLSQLELLMLDGGLGDLPFKKPTHHFESSL